MPPELPPAKAVASKTGRVRRARTSSSAGTTAAGSAAPADRWRRRVPRPPAAAARRIGLARSVLTTSSQRTRIAGGAHRLGISVRGRAAIGDVRLVRMLLLLQRRPVGSAPRPGRLWAAASLRQPPRRLVHCAQATGAAQAAAMCSSLGTSSAARAAAPDQHGSGRA